MNSEIKRAIGIAFYTIVGILAFPTLIFVLYSPLIVRKFLLH